MKKLSTEFVSAIQEFLRTLVQSMLVPIGGALVIIANGIDTNNGGFNINWLLAASVLAVGFVNGLNTAIVAGVDKYLYKSGVQTPLNFKSLDSLKE